jgi:hypothetical protein
MRVEVTPDAYVVAIDLLAHDGEDLVCQRAWRERLARDGW